MNPAGPKSRVPVIAPFPMNEENHRQRMAQLQAVRLAPDSDRLEQLIGDWRCQRAALGKSGG